ncbi:MAG: hypothetical protein PUK49_04800 [Oscillospiraceae bacterium]|nr:hypothetical protein [Oscillospiraceae bacterium]
MRMNMSKNVDKCGKTGYNDFRKQQTAAAYTAPAGLLCEFG